MNWEAVGAIGEIVGATAVVATLIYLASQVRHARNDQKLASIRNTRSVRKEWAKFLADSPYASTIIAKATAGEELTDEEKVRLIAINGFQWGMLYGEWIDQKLNLPGEFALSDDPAISIMMGMPGAQDWFDNYGRTAYPREFIEYMDKRMKELKQMTFLAVNEIDADET